MRILSIGIVRASYDSCNNATHQVAVTQCIEVAARAPGQHLVPDDVVHGAAAVVPHRACKERGRVAVARPQFEDLSRTDRTGKLVAEMAAGRADDRESVLAGVGLHALKLGWPRRDQTVEVVTDLGGQQIAHRRASGCGRRGDDAGRLATLRQASPRVLDMALLHEAPRG